MDNDFEDDVVAEESSDSSQPVGPKFKLGDVVRLKSGGPSMAVEAVDEDTDPPFGVTVTWFTSTDGHWHPEPQTSQFTQESLELVPPQSDLQGETTKPKASKSKRSLPKAVKRGRGW